MLERTNGLLRTQKNIVEISPLGIPGQEEILKAKNYVATLDEYALEMINVMKDIARDDSVDGEGRPIVSPLTRVQAAKGVLSGGMDYIHRRVKLMGTQTATEEKEVMEFSDENRISMSLPGIPDAV